MQATWGRRARVYLAVAALYTAGAVPAFAGAYLSKTSGIVQIQHSGSDRWDMVRDLPQPLVNEDTVRTGQRAAATLSFDDGSRVELGGNATFTLEEATRGRSLLRLNFGAIKAFVSKIASRRFDVKTPTAVCSVRGTEFRVEVMAGGRTQVDLFKGLLAVEDRRGNQILLHPNERVQVDLRGLNKAGGLPSQKQQRQSEFHQLMQKEMAISMSKADVMAAAAREVKLAEFQQGKALIDVNGNRVRLDEYIIRPSANQFKLVVLNEREARFDFFYYLGTFNQNLPADLRVALNQLSGTVDNPPQYYLTAFQTARSNTIDSMVENATGGHPVDVNHNGVPADQISYLFNPVTNAYDNVSGRNVYQTLFDNYGFYVNGGLKYGWTGTSIQSYSLVTAATTNDPFTNALLPAALPARSVSTTFPDPDQIHQVVYESYADGSFIKWDNYIFKDDGKIANMSDFQSANSGVSYKQKILNFNYEQIVTASEFQGRKIDLVVEPKILVQSGLIQ
jgi:hypothetical protein